MDGILPKLTAQNDSRAAQEQVDKQQKEYHPISCSNCKWLYSVRDKKGRVVGHVCWCWLDGIAGSSDYFNPDEQCFEHK